MLVVRRYRQKRASSCSIQHRVGVQDFPPRLAKANDLSFFYIPPVLRGIRGELSPLEFGEDLGVDDAVESGLKWEGSACCCCAV